VIVLYHVVTTDILNYGTPKLDSVLNDLQIEKLPIVLNLTQTKNALTSSYQECLIKRYYVGTLELGV